MSRLLVVNRSLESAKKGTAIGGRKRVRDPTLFAESTNQMPPDTISRIVTDADIPAIEALHDRAFGPGRYARTAYRIREGLKPFSPLCRIAERNGRLVAALRMAPVTIGGKSGAELLGPLSVEPALAGQGIGRALVGEALACARQAGIQLVVLVGDLSYYQRFGFRISRPGQLLLPGPVDQSRLLILELVAGTSEGYRGEVRGAIGG